MAIKLVVFDMAGTTVYDNDDVAISLVNALNGKGYIVSVQDVNSVMGMPKPEAIKSLIRQQSTDVPSPELVAAVYQEFEHQMVSHYANHPAVREIDGVSDVFRTLRAHNIKVGIDTGFARVVADTIIDRLGWLRHAVIDLSVTSDEVANGRPFPDMIYKAMELAGVSDPAEVAKAGDTISDLREGTAAGCRYVIGLPGKANTADELRQYPHTHIISEISDVPGIVLQ